jgi:hypothetical protein
MFWEIWLRFKKNFRITLKNSFMFGANKTKQMKKSFTLLAAALLVCIGFSSCKKCVTCSYTPPGEAQVSEEFCSTSSTERDAFEAGQQIEAAFEGTTASCD